MATKTPSAAATEVAASASPAVKHTPRFIISDGGKGGVGKSFTALAIADYLSSQGIPVAVIDADTNNPDVNRMFNGTVLCKAVNLREDEGWMDVMDFVIENPGHTFIMNTPGGVRADMTKGMPMFAGFLGKQENPIDLELWWTMNNDWDSVILFDAALKGYGHFFTQTHVVCNMHFTDDKAESFYLWNECHLQNEQKSKGGLTIYMPGLHVRIMVKLFNPEKVMPFFKAIDKGIGERIELTESERYRLDLWREDVYTRIAPVFGRTYTPLKTTFASTTRSLG